ncbi:ATP-binding protein [Ideonella sp.]|uniref:ATP-binding protein n=1 Tax=Ideonella sp. TaxID=1929293 RepID=UPI002B472318|nr:CHASE domain-containing protein [Ideonella sp.]HJV69973.1 CHASE domain-containing protein [Ideonella sp.]
MIDRPISSLSPGTRLLVLNFALALAYYLTALLGMALGIGPLHITAIWPPSGIALAGFMLLGTRALPGLAIGAVLTHYLDFFGPQMDWNGAAVLGSVLLASGSILQAALAAQLTRGVPGRIEASPVRPTVRFALVVLACGLIAATVGRATLYAFGVLAPRELFYGWLTWWVGDVVGMLIVAPALLLLWHPALRTRRVAVQAFPIICLGLGLTLFSTLSIGVMERDVHIERFRAEGSRLAMALQNHVDMAQRDLETLQRLFYKNELDPAEFRAVSGPMLNRSPWQQHFAYLPRVAAAERDRFETRQGGISLRELSPRDTVVIAGARPEYFPVLWTAPEAGHDALVGIDHLADPQRGPAVEKARASGQIAASLPLHSVAQSATDELVQVLYAPLSNTNLSDRLPHDPAQVNGMVAATIDLGQLLRAAVAQMDTGGHHLLLYDPDAPAAHALEWPVGEALAVRDQAERQRVLPVLNSGIHHEVALRVADRRWALLMQPAWAELAPEPGWLQLGVLSSGLIFTVLLTGFMIARRRHDLLVVGQQQALESQVAARTAELAHSNETLRAEVAERERAEGELREARQRAESANRAKSMFLANMSHEIRTPLNAVLGFAQILLADRSLPAATRHRLEVIHSAGNRLLNLINDVLDLAKIESGKLTLVAQIFDLHRELIEIGHLFASRVSAKGLAWQLELDELPAPAVVHADRTKLGQVVINLLGNALKFTEAGCVRLRAWRDGPAVWIEIEDTGPGMGQAELERLFEPFSQGEAGRDKGGSGLGLVLSRDIARAMGGELSIISAPGAGTRARVMLPLPVVAQDAGLPAAEPDIARLEPGRRCRALVVEDDPDSRELLVKLLKDIGCQVEQAEDGQAGLDACRRQPFDIVFSDIRMPRLTGVDMIRALRADPATATLPVVAVTASSLEHERRFYIEIGFQDFVPKPFPFRDIYRMLAQHADARFIAGEADRPAAPEADAPLPLLRPDADTLRRLRELRAAAAEGDLGRVKRALAAIDDAALGAARRQAWEDAARRYDFQGLEEAVRTTLAQVTAPA